MARINLLPWREERRKERERNFYLLLGAAAVATLAILFSVHSSIAGQISFQKQRNGFLTQQISVLDQEIQTIRSLEVEKARMLQRMKVIQELQSSRPEIVHMFDELVNTIPDGVRLLKAEDQGRTLTLEGVADTNALISAFMRQLDSSPWMSNPELIVIDSRKPEFPNASWFTLKVQQVSHQGDQS